MRREGVKAKKARLLLLPSCSNSRGEPVYMLCLIKHSVLISLSLLVLQDINTISILLHFFSPSTVSLPRSPMKDEKGLATVNAICRNTDLEGALPLVPAASGLLKPNSFSAFLVISC
jgi:hypothetical protein